MVRKTKRKPKHDLEQLEHEYTTLRPLLAQLHDELLHQLTGLLGQAGVALSFPIQHRVKTWSSISEKLQRVPLSLSSLRDLQDLVGIRIVLQFRRDVDRVCSLIDQNLKVITRYDTVSRLKEDQFGYSSMHFVAEVPASWLAVPTMAALADLRAEVQVRTTAQHIWAEASQTLQYKSKEAVPPALKRSIYRVSALLETVDLEFERVLMDREEYRAALVRRGPITERLNSDTLAQILDASWPKVNKDSEGEGYADLLADLSAMGVKQTDALGKLIAKWRGPALESDAEVVNLVRSDSEEAKQYAIRTERVDAGVFYTHVGLTRVALRNEFGAAWTEYERKKLQPKKVSQ